MKGRDWESSELSSYQEEMAPEIFIKKSSGDALASDGPAAWQILLLVAIMMTISAIILHLLQPGIK